MGTTIMVNTATASQMILVWSLILWKRTNMFGVRPYMQVPFLEVGKVAMHRDLVVIGQGCTITVSKVAMLTPSIPLISTLAFPRMDLEIYSILRLPCTSLDNRKRGSVLDKDLLQASRKSQMRFAGDSLQDSVTGTRVRMGLTGLTSQTAI